MGLWHGTIICIIFRISCLLQATNAGAIFHNVQLIDIYIESSSQQLYEEGLPTVVTMQTTIGGSSSIKYEGNSIFKFLVFFADNESCTLGNTVSPNDSLATQDFNLIQRVNLVAQVTLPASGCTDVIKLCVRVAHADCSNWLDPQLSNNIACVDSVKKKCNTKGYIPDGVLPTQQDGCPSGFLTFPASASSRLTCYRVFNARKNFTDAEHYCQMQGGHLASISNVKEHYFIEDLVKTFSQKSDYHSYIWFGLQKPPGSVQWEWTDKTQSGFRQWDDSRLESRPAVDGGLCSAVQTAFDCPVSQRRFKWTALPCDINICYGGLPFICEVVLGATDLPPSISSTRIGSTVAGDNSTSPTQSNIGIQTESSTAETITQASQAVGFASVFVTLIILILLSLGLQNNRL